MEAVGSQAARRAERTSRRSLERTRQSGASRKTVLVALAANGAIAVAKAGGALISGSAGMLAEAAHSLADTTNQVFLLVSIGLSEREPTPERPFGHGQERFLWTFMAAVGMFLAGAVFAIGFGIYELLGGLGETSGYGIAYAGVSVSAGCLGNSGALSARPAVTASHMRCLRSGRSRREPRGRGRFVRREARPRKPESRSSSTCARAAIPTSRWFCSRTPPP